MDSPEDIAHLDMRIDELKEYLIRVEKRIDTIYTDMGHVRENMATREDLNRVRGVMATSKDVDRLWKLNWVYLGAILALLGTLVIYFLTKND